MGREVRRVPADSGVGMTTIKLISAAVLTTVACVLVAFFLVFMTVGLLGLF